MKLFVVPFCLFVFAVPAWAQSAIDRNLAQQIALSAYPGKIQDSHERDNYYEYEILQEDGTSLDVQIGNRVGNIKQVEIEEFGMRFDDLQKSLIKPEDAKDIAIDYFKDRDGDLRNLEIKNVSRLLAGDDWFYGVDLEVQDEDYEIHVNRVDGQIVRILRYRDEG